jgi:hypothetical protein
LAWTLEGSLRAFDLINVCARDFDISSEAGIISNLPVDSAFSNIGKHRLQNLEGWEMSEEILDMLRKALSDTLEFAALLLRLGIRCDPRAEQANLTYPLT